MQKSQIRIPHTEASSTSVDEVQIKSELIHQIYSQSLLGMYGGIFGAIALTVLMWSVVPRWHLIIWLLIFLAIQIPRHLLSRAFEKASPADNVALNWETPFILGSSLTAATWGATAIFLFPTNSFLHILLLVAILVAVAASAVMTYLPLKRCYITYILLILAPLFTRLLYEGGETFGTLAAIGPIFAVALIGTGHSVHKKLVESIRLKLEKDRLVQELQNTHRHLEAEVADRTAELSKRNEELNGEIAQRYHTEQALRESEARYRELFEHSGDAIYIHDLNGNYLSVNKAVKKVMGWEREAFLTLNFRDIVLPEDLAQTEENFRKKIENGVEETGPYEIRIFTEDGSPRWIEVTSKILRKEGNSVGIQGSVRNIDDRKRAEESFLEEKLFVQELLETAVDTIFVFDPITNQPLRWNAAFRQISGYSDAEIASMRAPHDFYEEADVREAEKATQELFEKGSVNVELNLVTAHGKRVPFEYSASLIKDDKGEPKYVIAIGRDMTERKVAEEILEISEKRLRKIMDLVPHHIFAKDKNGRFILANQAVAEAYATTLEDLVGKKDADFCPCPEEARHFQDEDLRVIERGESIVIPEQLFTDSEGKVHVLHTTKIPFNESGSDIPAVLGVSVDITERKQLEERLQQAAKMEAIGQLSGGIAHDFNNLLTAMIGYANILSQQLPQEGPYQSKLAQIVRAAERAAGLTQQLLAFGRKQMLNKTLLNLNSVIRDFETMLRRLIGENIEIVTLLHPHIEKVHADPGQVEQILMNLSVNARDAMPNGGKLTIETSATHLDSKYALTHPGVTPGRYVLITISDNGRGMEDEILGRIFDPFFTTKEKGVGTGLGLSTVYGIVKQHDGHISVYSEPDHGTTFRVYFPLTKEHSDRDVPDSEEKTSSQGTETVLVVEDEDIVLNLACEALQTFGYSPLAASDRDQAISVCKNHSGPIHLMLTDVVLPKTDGRSLYQELSPTRQEMKVLYMSGHTEQFIVQHGVLDKEVHFLQKPFSVESLGAKVRAVLDEK